MLFHSPCALLPPRSPFFHAVASVSPLERCFAETLSTLKFAQRAKLIRNQAIVNEGCIGTQQALQAEIRRLRAELAARPTVVMGSHATTAHPAAAASSTSGHPVDAISRRLSMAVAPGRPSLAPLAGAERGVRTAREAAVGGGEAEGCAQAEGRLRLSFGPLDGGLVDILRDDDDDENDGDRGGGGSAASREASQTALRLAKLHAVLCRMHEQMEQMTDARDAAHKQQAGYMQVLAAKDQQVVALRMQLRMARDQLSKTRREEPHVQHLVAHAAALPSALPSALPTAPAAADAKTSTALVASTPAPVSARKKASCIGRPSAVPSAVSACASPPSAPAEPPPTDGRRGVVAATPSVTPAATPSATPSATPPATTAAPSAGGPLASALTSLSAAEVAEVEARAIDSSGLRAEVLRASHEKEVAEAHVASLRAQLSALQASVAAPAVAAREAEVTTLRAELAECIRSFGARQHALSLELGAVTAEKERAMARAEAAAAEAAAAEARLTEGTARSQAHVEETLSTLTAEYEQIIAQLVERQGRGGEGGEGGVGVEGEGELAVTNVATAASPSTTAAAAAATAAAAAREAELSSALQRAQAETAAIAAELSNAKARLAATASVAAAAASAVAASPTVAAAAAAAAEAAEALATVRHSPTDDAVAGRGAVASTPRRREMSSDAAAAAAVLSPSSLCLPFSPSPSLPASRIRGRTQRTPTSSSHAHERPTGDRAATTGTPAGVLAVLSEPSLPTDASAVECAASEPPLPTAAEAAAEQEVVWRHCRDLEAELAALERSYKRESTEAQELRFKLTLLEDTHGRHRPPPS